MAEEQERRRRRPVEVVEDEHGGSDRGQRHGDGLEQELTFDGRVGRRRRGEIGRQRSCDRHEPRQLGEVRPQLVDEAGIGAREEPAHRLGERLERRREILVAAAVEHGRAVVVRPLARPGPRASSCRCPARRRRSSSGDRQRRRAPSPRRAPPARRAARRRSRTRGRAWPTRGAAAAAAAAAGVPMPPSWARSGAGRPFNVYAPASTKVRPDRDLASVATSSATRICPGSAAVHSRAASTTGVPYQSPSSNDSVADADPDAQGKPEVGLFVVEAGGHRLQRSSALDAVDGAGEAGHEPVALRLDLLPAVLGERSSPHGEAGAADVVARGVADPRHELGRADQVAEEDGDRRERRHCARSRRVPTTARTPPPPTRTRPSPSSTSPPRRGAGSPPPAPACTPASSGAASAASSARCPARRRSPAVGEGERPVGEHGCAAGQRRDLGGERRVRRGLQPSRVAVVPAAVEAPGVAHDELGVVVHRTQVRLVEQVGRCPHRVDDLVEPGALVHHRQRLLVQRLEQLRRRRQRLPHAVLPDHRHAVARQQHLGRQRHHLPAARRPTPSDSAAPSAGCRRWATPR